VPERPGIQLPCSCQSNNLPFIYGIALKAAVSLFRKMRYIPGRRDPVPKAGIFLACFCESL